LAGSLLQAYYGETKEPAIKLTNPKQVLLLDAMAEAAGIPHQRGQTEITIPEKLRNYNKYLMTHGSVIFISPLKSIGCNDLMTDFGKPRSNDFNRLEGKWANRRSLVMVMRFWLPIRLEHHR